MEGQQFNKKYVIIIYIGRIFSVYPFECSKKSRRYFQCFLAVAQIILFIISYIYAIVTKEVTLFEGLVIEKLTDDVAHFSLTFSNIFNIVTVIFYKHSGIIKLLDDLTTVDRTLNHKPENNCCKYKVNVLQLFALVVFIADLAFGFHILGTTMYFRYFLPRYLQASQLNAMIFIVASIMKEITDRFESLNGLLGQMKQERLNVIEGPDSDRRNNKDDVYSDISNQDEDRENDCTNCPCEKLYQLRKAHIFLCNKVDEYNALFGTVLLFLLFVITVVWLDCTVFFASIHILRANAARFHFDQGHGMLYFILIGIFWIVGALIQAFALASTGEKLLNESNKTSKTCADILANIRPVKTPDLDRCFRRELEMLFRQSSLKKSCVSAAGFFEVNNKMLGVMAANVSSYLLIILQFLTQHTE